MAVKNAFYAQSGGVTAVINVSACGVLETSRQHSEKIGRVYAGRNGIIGALTEDTPRVPFSGHVATSSVRSASTARNTSV